MPRLSCRKISSGASVILPDVPERLLKHIVVADLELDVQRLDRSALRTSWSPRIVDCQPSKRTAFTTSSIRLTMFSTITGVLVGLERLEQLGQGGLALLLAGHLVDSLLGCYGVAGQLQEFA